MGRARTRRPYRLLPTLLAAIALAGCAGPSPTPGPSASPAPSAPAASPTTAPSPTASTGPTSWSPVKLADLPQVASLEPITAGPAAVATDTAFRLRSLDGRSPADLAAHLVAQPEIEFNVVSLDGDTAIVKPARPLLPRASYRISLTRPDGSAEASWSAQVAGPLQITETVPGDATTKVPLTTGIEIRFDQYGVTTADLARHFSIRPTVEGRFVAAGQAVAFVPKAPLAKGRLYTVTISRGLPLPGTDEVLEADYTFRFETVAKVASPVLSWFPRALVDTATANRPELAVEFSFPDGSAPPRSLPITVHRVAGIAAAQAAWRAILAAPEWTQVSATEPVPTAGLTQVFKGTVALKAIAESNTRWFALPSRLAAGWYLVTERWAGVPRQTLLQVTDLATFSMVSTDRTVVWVNDLRTKAVVTDASVAVDGTDFGRTDSRGLAIGATPAAVASSAYSKLVVVTAGSRSAFYPLAMEQPCADCLGHVGYDTSPTGMPGPGAQGEDWWRLLYTDRSAYRTTDTINVWGMARDRDTGAVPATVTVSVGSFEGDGGAPIASAQATPDHAGAFAARLSLRDVPMAPYTVRLTVDSTVIAESWLDVTVIAKPAWQLSLDTTPHAVIGNATVALQAQAAFFDGTPVAGTPVSITDGDATRNIRTNASGRASTTFPVSAGYCNQQCETSIEGSATLPEEGEINATAGVVTFKAAGFVDAEASVSGTRLTITGKVSNLALDRFEVPGANASDVNPRGTPLARARVVLLLSEEWSVRVKTGTQYDFITKQVVPVYENQDRSRSLAVPVVTTAADGTFRVLVTVRGGNRLYRVTAAYTDPKGRQTSVETYASQTSDAVTSLDPAPDLVNAGTHPQSDEYTVGETVRVKFTGGLASPSTARYLYAISQRGLRYVTVGTTPTFRTTFETTSLPSIAISAVRFNGTGYETAIGSYTATAAMAPNRLTVEVTADRARYAPGDTATVTVRTLGPSGSPVSASVYLGVVDEKLYAMNLASQPDPLSDLYQTVGDGIIAVVSSHLTPGDDARRYGQGGDTTGGGGEGLRSDFRDWLVATLVTTDASGRASVTVPLSDDLTSWHVAASALDASLRGGSGSGSLPVGLPLFVEATLQPEYLEGEQVVLRVRGFGTSLQASDQVTFTVSSDTLPMASATKTAKAFEAAELTLPALSLGTHTLRITGTARGQTDSLLRSFTVVASRSVRAVTTWEPLAAPTGVKAGTSGAFTRLLLVDAGRGRVVPALSELGGVVGGRSDELLAAALANRVLADVFGLDPAPSAGDRGIGSFVAEKGGLAIVPYGSSNLDVTALAAMARDPLVDAGNLRSSLAGVAFDEHAKRDRRLLALAGLAGLGDPVLGEVRTAAALTDLSIQEETSVAIAAFYAGDEALAGRLERKVLADHALAYGPWIRVNTGQAESDVLTTARLAIVAASLGDPASAQLDAWLENHPATTTLTVLERALAASGWAHRAGGAKAVAAVTVDGARREVAIEPGKPASLALTSAQAASARLEPVSGSVLVVTSREVPIAAASLTKPDGVAITRSIAPAGRIAVTDRVVVTIKITLAKAARGSVWRLVDWTPSGLKAIGGDRWDTSSASAWTVGPDSVNGQRVDATVGGDPKIGTWTLRYIARVVSPGTYRWEGTVIQSAIAPDRGIVLPAKTITIGGASGG